MALLKTEEDLVIGVCYLLAPAWRQGYYWMPGMDNPRFTDNPKQLANDVIWITNAPFNIAVNYGKYIKHANFFRIPFDVLFNEVTADLSDVEDKVIRYAKFLQKITKGHSAYLLRDATTLSQAIKADIGNDLIHPNWEKLGEESKSWYWKGSNKHKLLLGGSLMPPRFENARQLLRLSVPDFSKAPHVIKQELSGDLLREVLAEKVGFCRVSISSISKSINDFMDLERTLLTTNEVKWLIDRAHISVKYAYLTDPIDHPGFKAEWLNEYKNYSWSDGLKMESLYLAPGINNFPMESWLRANAHLAMALYAEYLTVNKSIVCLGLSLGKIKCALTKNEIPHFLNTAKMSGLIASIDEDIGVDIIKEKY